MAFFFSRRATFRSQFSIVIVLFVATSGARGSSSVDVDTVKGLSDENASTKSPVTFLELPSLAEGIKYRQPGMSSHSWPPSERVANLKEEFRSQTASLKKSMGVCACSADESSPSARRIPMGQTSLKDSNGRRFAVSVMSFDLALKLFQKIDKLFPRSMNTLRDGCFARAHKVAMLLEEQGVLAGKVMAKGKFQIFSNQIKTGTVFWGFHVAPVVVVKSGGKRAIWVLDPSLFSEPAPLESWMALLTQDSGAQLKEVFLTNRFVFHPDHAMHEIDSWRSVDLRNMKKILRSN